MKRFNLTVVIFLLCGMMAFAQNRPCKHRAKKANRVEQAERMTQRMAQELDLTADQQSKVKDINADFCKEMQAYRQKKRALNRICCGKDTVHLSDDARKTLLKVNCDEAKKLDKQLESLRQTRQNKLKKVLTTDQYSRLEQIRKNPSRCCFPLKNGPECLSTAN